MPLSHDTILLETVRTRRSRLRSALLHGAQDRRRPVQDNLRRLVGSLVVAAVACAGCVGFALVTSLAAARDAGRGDPLRPAPAVTAPTATPAGDRP